MVWIDIITVFALVQYFAFGVMVARARGLYGVKAPATTGNEIFERYFRVQMNTLEVLVIFIPAFWLAARYWRPHWIALLGLLYIVGRFIYYKAYVKDPSTRGLGHLLSIIPIFILLIAVVVGAVWTQWVG